MRECFYLFIFWNKCECCGTDEDFMMRKKERNRVRISLYSRTPWSTPSRRCTVHHRCNMTACWSAVNVELLKFAWQAHGGADHKMGRMSFKTCFPTGDVIREEHPAQACWLCASGEMPRHLTRASLKFLAFRRKRGGVNGSIAFTYSYPAGVSQTSQRHHLTPSLCHSQLFSSASSVNKMPHCSQSDTQH